MQFNIYDIYWKPCQIMQLASLSFKIDQLFRYIIMPWNGLICFIGGNQIESSQQCQSI